MDCCMFPGKNAFIFLVFCFKFYWINSFAPSEKSLFKERRTNRIKERVFRVLVLWPLFLGEMISMCFYLR